MSPYDDALWRYSDHMSIYVTGSYFTIAAHCPILVHHYRAAVAKTNHVPHTGQYRSTKVRCSNNIAIERYADMPKKDDDEDEGMLHKKNYDLILITKTWWDEEEEGLQCMSRLYKCDPQPKSK